MGASLSGKSGWQQLQRLFFDHLSHKVGHIRYMNSIPEPSLGPRSDRVKENHVPLCGVAVISRKCPVSPDISCPSLYRFVNFTSPPK